jgi:hypothetical protein
MRSPLHWEGKYIIDVGKIIDILLEHMKSHAFFNKTVLLGLCALAILGSSSCLPLAAGAAAGYIAHDEGYRVSNPIHKSN